MTATEDMVRMNYEGLMRALEKLFPRDMLLESEILSGTVLDLELARRVGRFEALLELGCEATFSSHHAKIREKVILGTAVLASSAYAAEAQQLFAEFLAHLVREERRAKEAAGVRVERFAAENPDSAPANVG